MATINFNDAIFAQEALQAFTATLTPLNIFSHDYNPLAAQKGSIVAVPRVDALTATTFSYTDNSGFPYENSGGTINTITINLDTQKITTVDITDVQSANSSAATMVNFARLQGQTLGKMVLQTIWGVFTTTNFGASIASGVLNTAGITRVAVSKARTAMAKRDVPIDRLGLILNEDAYDSVLQDASVVQTFSYGSSEVIRDANLPRLMGMDVYHTNILPANGISLVGAACHPDGVAVAMRYLEPQEPGAYISAMRVVDPVSGIVMGYRRHYNPGRGKMFASFEALFGFSVGLSLGIGLIVRTD